MAANQFDPPEIDFKFFGKFKDWWNSDVIQWLKENRVIEGPGISISDTATGGKQIETQVSGGLKVAASVFDDATGHFTAHLIDLSGSDLGLFTPDDS